MVNYLKGAKGSEHQRAERYIRNAPPDILTSYRAAIENALGWTCNRSATQNENLLERKRGYFCSLQHLGGMPQIGGKAIGGARKKSFSVVIGWPLMA